MADRVTGLEGRYARIAWGRAAVGRYADYRRVYVESIAPETAARAGLRGRQLLRSLEDPDEALSITLWDSIEDLQAYSDSPVRERLLPRLAHLWVDDEWPKAFELRCGELPAGKLERNLSARLAWGSVQPGLWGEFEAFYREAILPTTGSVDGLVGRALLRGLDDADSGISLSYWRSEATAREYPESRLYRDDLQPRLASLWVSHDPWARLFSTDFVSLGEPSAVSRA